MDESRKPAAAAPSGEEPGGAEAESRYRANLQGEIDSAALYRTLAEVEPDPKIASVYGRLASVEDAHAELWKKQLARIGARLPRLTPGFRTRALSFLARRFGP